MDLNLVRTFLLLYETRSVTRAAEQLSLTQPSVSHALARLRKSFNDNLFSRSPTGLEPTELAVSMYPTLRQALEVIDSTIDGVGHFEPANSRRVFQLHATDLGEINLLPPVLRAITAEAPGVGVHVTPLDITVMELRLRQGQADAVICTPPIAASDMVRDVLRHDAYCGFCSVAHPRIGNQPSLSEFLAERHVAVEATVGHTDVDRALGSMGHARDIAVRIEHFAPLPQLIEQTTLLSIIPRSVAHQFLQLAAVKTFELPFAVPAVQISLYTAKRRLPDAGVEWLRHTVRTAVGAPPPTAAGL